MELVDRMVIASSTKLLNIILTNIIKHFLEQVGRSENPYESSTPGVYQTLLFSNSS